MGCSPLQSSILKFKWFHIWPVGASSSWPLCPSVRTWYYVAASLLSLRPGVLSSASTTFALESVIFKEFMVSFYFYFYVLILEKERRKGGRERERVRQREWEICCSTYFCTHQVILVCALTGNQTFSLSILGGV